MLRAFHNDPKIKSKYLKRVRAHAKADEIIKGTYWQNGKGCAVGCTIHSSNHNAYETELGIPEWLARVEDRLFEGMSPARGKKWPAQFLSAVKPGVDLEKAKNPFLIVILKSCLKLMKKAKYYKAKLKDVTEAIEGSRKVIDQMIERLKEGRDITDLQSAAWAAAQSAEWAAAQSAQEAARAEWAAEACSGSESGYNSFATELLKILKNIK